MQTYTLNIRLFTKEASLLQYIDNLAPLQECQVHAINAQQCSPEVVLNAHIIIVDSALFDSTFIQQVSCTDAMIIVCLDPQHLETAAKNIYPFADEVWHLPLHKPYVTKRLQHLIHEVWHKHQSEVLQIYLDTVIDSSPDLIWFKDTRGVHLKVNQAFCEATGKTKEDIHGRGHYYIWDIPPDEYAQGEYVCLETEEFVLAKRERCLFEEKVKCKQGLRHFKTYKAPLIDADGNLLGTVGVAQDVHRNTPVTFMSDLSTSMNIAHLHVWKLNLQTREAEIGAVCAAELGLPPRMQDYPESLIEQGVISKESIDACHKAHEMLASGHTSVSYDALLVFPDGTERWRRINYSVYSDGPSYYALDGANASQVDIDHVIMLGTSEDIDQYKRMEKYFSIATAQNGIVSWMYDIDNGCIYSVVNPQGTLGGNAQLIYTITDFFINNTPLHKDDIDSVLNLHTKIAWGAASADIITRWRGQDEQDWSWFKISYTTVFDSVGQPVRAIGSALDISGQIKAEHLYSTQLAFRDNLTRDAVATLLLNLTANTVTTMQGDFCPSADKSTYRTADELFAALLQFTPTQEAASIGKFYNRKGLLRQFEEGQSAPRIIHLYGPSEAEASWVKVTAHIIRNPDSNDVEAFVHVADIDARKIIEASFSAVASQEHDSVFAVNVRQQDLTCIYDKSNPSVGEHESPQYNYDYYIFETYGAYVFKEDVQSFTDSMTLPVVMAGIEKNSVHSVYFRTLIRGTELRHKRVQFSYISKPRQLIYMVISDITNAFEAEQEKNVILSKALDAAKESSKAKTAFLANMSHEIRTPINTIIGMSEIALAKQLDQDIANDINTIRTAGNSLLGIINDILDLSKVESGKFDITTVSYKPVELLAEVSNMVNVRLAEKPIHFLITINPELPVRLRGDDNRIRQILTNIIGNAVKYTSQGYIILRVDGSYLPDGRYRLEMRVSDTGIGIKPEDIPLLFIQFNRVDTKRNRSISGTGLGLALSQQFAKLMQGDITVESSYGEGSTFIITIVQQVEEQTSRLQARMEGQKILLYEPDTVISRTISKALEAMGIGCTLCSKVEDIAAQNGLTHVVMRRKFLQNTQVHLGGRYHDNNIILLMDNDEHPDTTFMQYRQVPLPIFCLQVDALLNPPTRIVEQAKSSSSRSRVETLEGIRILVVDDNTTNLQVAKGLLAPYKMTVETALNGYQAIEMVRRQHFDIIFMDHMMPGLDGVETTTQIRALPGEHFQTVPIIALTANAFQGAKESFLKQGLTDFLAKPIEIPKLDRMIKHYATPLLEAAQARAAAAAAQKAPSPTPDSGEASTATKPTLPAPITTVAAATELIGGTSAPSTASPAPEGTPAMLLSSIPGINMQRAIEVYGSITVYHTILKTYGTDMATRVNELPVFIDQRDLKAFNISVHAIKSASRGVCAEALGDAAELLEELSKRGNMEIVLQHFGPFMKQLNTMVTHVQNFMNQWIISDDTTQGQVCKYMDTDRVARLQLACQSMDYALAETLITELSSCRYEDENIVKLLQSMQKCCNDFDYTTLDTLVESISQE